MPHVVSTIIPVHNRPEMIKLAVESVLAQDYRPIEIIIVDDGSTDNSLAACNLIAAMNPDIVKVISRPNGGPGPARETGRKLARGEFIQYLDSDDRLFPGKFNQQVALLRSRPDCDIAYGITRLVDAEGDTLAEPFKGTGVEREYLFPGLLVDRWWCTHTPLYRRTLTDQLGAWSDLRYSQDWEYDSRAGAQRAKLAYCNSLVSEHRHHSSMRQTGSGKWLESAEQVRFFTTLYECAVQAGVEHSTPEMRHFSRWVFSRARVCGMEGDVESARQLMKLARMASADMDTDMKFYSVMAAFLGWNFVGKLGDTFSAFSNKKKGSSSMKQSWMQ